MVAVPQTGFEASVGGAVDSGTPPTPVTTVGKKPVVPPTVGTVRNCSVLPFGGDSINTRHISCRHKINESLVPPMFGKS